MPNLRRVLKLGSVQGKYMDETRPGKAHNGYDVQNPPARFARQPLGHRRRASP